MIYRKCPVTVETNDVTAPLMKVIALIPHKAGQGGARATPQKTLTPATQTQGVAEKPQAFQVKRTRVPRDIVTLEPAINEATEGAVTQLPVPIIAGRG